VLLRAYFAPPAPPRVANRERPWEREQRLYGGYGPILEYDHLGYSD
jgi:hypothetical protein